MNGAPTIKQTLDMHIVLAPAVSPDGAKVVYEQTRTNWQDNEFETDLWLADVKSGERRRLTAPVKSSTHAAWSRDGRFIAFLSDRPGQLKDSPDGKRQLYMLSAEGGEAVQLTRFDKGVKAFEWLPDGRRLIVSAEAPDTQAVKDRLEAYGGYRVIHSDYDPVWLWRVAVPGPDEAGRMPPPTAPLLLTPGADFSVGTFAVSPDGAAVAFSAQRDPDMNSASTARIYTVPAGGGPVTVLTGDKGPDLSPIWSPDGSEIAYETANGDKNYFFANNAIAVVARDGGNPHVVNPAFDENANLLKWAPEGIYFQAAQKTELAIFLTDPKIMTTRRVELGNMHQAAQLHGDGPTASFSRDFKTIAFVGGGPNLFEDIYVVEAGQRRAVKLTHADTQTQGFATARREVVKWNSVDGTPIEGILYKPQDFDPKKAYPLLVVIHGGPTMADAAVISPDRDYPVERFVAKGALVLKPNYRGSAGYGAKFRALNVRNLGVGDYWDVISGVDFLVAKGIVDKSRVGAMGWSEGGYISAFIATASDRFKAVSVGAGISDWQTYYANTDVTQFTRQYLAARPWADPEVYSKTSPITYIAKARTPTLIQHGANDNRVPIANAYELRQALDDHGVPVRMVVFDGFGHLIDKPKQQGAVMEQNERWFSHYIWGDPLPGMPTPDFQTAPAKTDVFSERR